MDRAFIDERTNYPSPMESKSPEQEAVKVLREEFDFNPPLKTIVCPSCDGRGTQTLGGASFTAEDFAEDPEFAENYMRGRYDEDCPECKGRNVIRVVNEEYLEQSNPEMLKEYHDIIKSIHQMDAEHRAEWRAGC